MRPWSSVPYANVPFDKLHSKYDYIIVGTSFSIPTCGAELRPIFTGGGTAGCVLANRLSTMPEKTVLLIERGPVGDTWISRIPLISSSFMSGGAFSRLQMSDYQPELNKAFELARGSGLGGTSRINTMLYTRGLPKEYDLWAESGCEGWAWRDVERFFKKSENFLDGLDEENVHGKTGRVLKSGQSPFLILTFIH
jgi:choline dehydrogenase